MIDLYLTYQSQIYKALGETALLMGISFIFALIGGSILGTLIYMTRSGGEWEKPSVNFFSNLYVNIVRSFPFILFVVFLMPFTRWIMGISLGTLPATVPMSLVAIALYARFVEQALLEVPQGIVDSAKTMQATDSQLIVHFLYSESLPNLVLGLTSTTISLLSYSTVMGVVGAGGIGAFAMTHGYQNHQYDLMALVIIMIILVVQTIQFIGTTTAKKLDKR